MIYWHWQKDDVKLSLWQWRQNQYKQILGKGDLVHPLGFWFWCLLFYGWWIHWITVLNLKGPSWMTDVYLIRYIGCQCFKAKYSIVHLVFDYAYFEIAIALFCSTSSVWHSFFTTVAKCCYSWLLLQKFKSPNIK